MNPENIMFGAFLHQLKVDSIMSLYLLKRVFHQYVGCPLSKYVLCLLAYYPQFSINSLAKDSELSHLQIEESLKYLAEKKLIKFRNGIHEGQNGTEYQIEILF